MNTSRGQIVLGVWVLSVVVAIGVGLYLLGSPADERARRTDARRVADLEAIADATDLYWTRHDDLPASLDELRAEPGVRVSSKDPGGLEDYGYAPLDSARYEVCASFEQESSEMRQVATRRIFAHGIGRQCFVIEATKVDRDPRPERTERSPSDQPVGSKPIG